MESMRRPGHRISLKVSTLWLRTKSVDWNLWYPPGKMAGVDDSVGDFGFSRKQQALDMMEEDVEGESYDTMGDGSDLV